MKAVQGEASLASKLRNALQKMESALVILDEAECDSTAPMHLELAICRVRDDVAHAESVQRE